jgi:hypothetical protein
MSALEHDLTLATEATESEVSQLRVAAWRTEQFDRLGFDAQDAAFLGCMTDVHHLYAKRLLDNGCSHSEAVQILA